MKVTQLLKFATKRAFIKILNSRIYRAWKKKLCQFRVWKFFWLTLNYHLSGLLQYSNIRGSCWENRRVNVCTGSNGTERLSFRSKKNFSILFNSNWIVNQFIELSKSFSGRGPMLRQQSTVPRSVGGSQQIAGKYLFIYLSGLLAWWKER